MLEVFIFLDALEGAVWAPVHVSIGDARMLGDHVGGEHGRLYGSIRAMLTFVDTIL